MTLKTSCDPVGLLLKNMGPEVPLGCSVGRLDLICSQTQPKRVLKCAISPTNHITGNWTNQIARNEPTRSLIPKM